MPSEPITLSVDAPGGGYDILLGEGLLARLPALLDERGRYRITIGQGVENSADQQAIKVDPGVKRGIVELRVTLPYVREPLTLPSITQNGRVLVEEGRP